jgi:hypothetical protein
LSVARKPNIAAAGADFAFAALALAAGVFAAQPIYLAMVLVGALATWGWTRRRSLAAMPMGQRVTNSAIALVMIVAVLAISYWIGLIAGGHT